MVDTNEKFWNFQQYHGKKCRECGNTIWIYDKHHDEIFCLKCGIIFNASK